ncbi:MAG TPA: hypothetical protein EYP85_13055 [Armatimonadetes bacterium]|nr:hypothetical protein [Armatimonadota bacterium]
MGEVTEENVCYRCGATLDEDSEHCPACGRSQFRICYCGQRIWKGLNKCPYCGADWSHKRRHVEKRKHRSRSRRRWWRVKFQRLYAYVMGGALIGALAGSLITPAVRSLPNSVPVSTPPGKGDAISPAAPVTASPEPDPITRIQRRFVEFASNIWLNLTRVTARVWRIFRNHPGFFGGTFLGGLLGAIVYLKGLRLRWPWRWWRRRGRRVRRRRVY